MILISMSRPSLTTILISFEIVLLSRYAPDITTEKSRSMKPVESSHHNEYLWNNS